MCHTSTWKRFADIRGHRVHVEVLRSELRVRNRLINNPVRDPLLAEAANVHTHVHAHTPPEAPCLTSEQKRLQETSQIFTTGIKGCLNVLIQTIIAVVGRRSEADTHGTRLRRQCELCLDENDFVCLTPRGPAHFYCPPPPPTVKTCL